MAGHAQSHTILNLVSMVGKLAPSFNVVGVKMDASRAATLTSVVVASKNALSPVFVNRRVAVSFSALPIKVGRSARHDPTTQRRRLVHSFALIPRNETLFELSGRVQGFTSLQDVFSKLYARLGAVLPDQCGCAPRFVSDLINTFIQDVVLAVDEFFGKQFSKVPVRSFHWTSISQNGIYGNDAGTVKISAG